MEEIKEIIYFDEPGPQNTDSLLRAAKKRIDELKIKHVVIASQAGVTVKQFLKIARGENLNIVAVTNVRGAKMLITALYNKYEVSRKIREDYAAKGITHFQAAISDKDREEFEKQGVKVYYSPDILNIGEPWGLEADNLSEYDEAKKRMRDKLRPFIPGHIRPLDIEAGADLSLLNIISMGFRVAVGIIAVAVKHGYVPENELACSIAGTGFSGGGADTGIIIQARANPKACQIKEIIGFPKLK